MAAGDVPSRRLYTGNDLKRAISIADLRAMAQRRLPAFAFEYLEGGSEEEATLERNRAAFAEYRFVAHALADVSQRTIATRLFDRPLSLPLVIAPTGLNGLYRAGADRMLAQAAAGAGIVFAQSTMSNMPMEQIAAVPGLRHWWQLYVFGPPPVYEALIARADKAGCEALIVTIDAQIFGNREWSRRKFAAPRRLSAATLLDGALHLQWLASTLLRDGMPAFANVIDTVPQQHRSFFDSAFWIRSQMLTTLDWKIIARIRQLWPRKLLIKGLLGTDDVMHAAELGVDGVVLSNHGGRQLDWTIAGLDALPAARRAVGDRLAILVDGGIRRGTDVLKALALGADAVLIGRAALYGVASHGSAGAARAIEIFGEEIDRALGMLGVTSIAALSPDVLTRFALDSDLCVNDARRPRVFSGS